MNATERIEVIEAYGAALENMEFTVGNEADLPYPKETIKKALAVEIIENTGSFPVDLLELVYSNLESWTDEQGFKKIAAYETHLKNKPSSSSVEEIRDHAIKLNELVQGENNVVSINKSILKKNIQATAQLRRFKELREE